MFRIIAVIFALVGIIYGLPNGEHRVVNGTNAEEAEFPYIVSLRRALLGAHLCGASIITQQWILTAGHCVYRKSESDVNVQYGVTKISPDKRNVIKVSKIIIHERYDNIKVVNDIAVIKLQEPLKYNEFVQPVKLPIQGQFTPSYSLAILVGWGLNATGGSIQNHLQKVDLITFSDEYCYERHNGMTRPTNICAGVPNGGKGQCSGDSGSPLTVYGIQVGIASWSVKPCGIAPYPGVYTKVSSYINWIKKYVKLSNSRLIIIGIVTINK